jgi:hypothetical protein
LIANRRTNQILAVTGDGKPGHYRPGDKLLAFLDAL